MKYVLNKNKFLSESEYQHLDDCLKRFKFKNCRDVLLIEIALRTGARAQEILNLTKADLNTETRAVFIRGLKGSNDREIPVSPSFFQELQTFSKDLSREDKLFNIGYHRLRQVWHEYRPCEKDFHSLRHTFALRLYKKHRDVKLVMLALGHASIINTMVYVDFTYNENELRRLIL